RSDRDRQRARAPLSLAGAARLRRLDARDPLPHPAFDSGSFSQVPLKALFLPTQWGGVAVLRRRRGHGSWLMTPPSAARPPPQLRWGGKTQRGATTWRPLSVRSTVTSTP